MDIVIRQETATDHKAVFNLIQSAFEKELYSDHKEQFLVERLRKSDSFIPELSLVALLSNTIVGHILLTKVKIKNDSNEFDSLALAPVSVLPEYHNKGVGSKLILAAHENAIELGYESVVLLGHEKYYPRFGYKQSSSEFNISFPFEAPAQNCMATELKEAGLKDVSGTVVYAKEFFE